MNLKLQNINDLNLLFDHKIDFISQDSFVSSEQASRFVNFITQLPEWKEAEIASFLEADFAGKKKPMHMFEGQYQVITRGMSEKKFLEQGIESRKLWKKIVEHCKFDFFELLKEHINQKYHISISCLTQDNLEYFPFVIRDLSEEILPHADFGPLDGKDWAVNQITKQIAWNIYLTTPASGGETVLYEEFWTDESQTDDNSYAIRSAQNVPIKNTFSPAAGKLVFFNSQRVHSVRKSSSDRIAIGGFIGLTKDHQCFAWV